MDSCTRSLLVTSVFSTVKLNIKGSRRPAQTVSCDTMESAVIFLTGESLNPAGVRLRRGRSAVTSAAAHAEGTSPACLHRRPGTHAPTCTNTSYCISPHISSGSTSNGCTSACTHIRMCARTHTHTHTHTYTHTHTHIIWLYHNASLVHTY